MVVQTLTPAALFFCSFGILHTDETKFEDNAVRRANEKFYRALNAMFKGRLALMNTFGSPGAQLSRPLAETRTFRERRRVTDGSSP